ncbi:hypothetical protein WG68_13915 [Arsukibacterium ikkense]|uniref:Uncharacterized protein n=1 Tax=Arsukibacterium ikkense TaxID=336831 RepID=A0A0M2V1F2_9GAMM|nr:hypothetical protein WG68_13915 [Arsukibacterium ikkense]
MFFAISFFLVLAAFIPVLNKVPLSEIVFLIYAAMFLIFGLYKTELNYISPIVNDWAKKILVVIAVLFGIWTLIFGALI